MPVAQALSAKVLVNQRMKRVGMRWSMRSEHPHLRSGCRSIFVKILFHTPVLFVGTGFPPSGGIQAVVRAACSGRHAASKRPDNALKVRTFWPPSTLQRARFMRWLTSTLFADDAGAAVPGLEARVGGACACGRT